MKRARHKSIESKHSPEQFSLGPTSSSGHCQRDAGARRKLIGGAGVVLNLMLSFCFNLDEDLICFVACLRNSGSSGSIPPQACEDTVAEGGGSQSYEKIGGNVILSGCEGAYRPSALIKSVALVRAPGVLSSECRMVACRMARRTGIYLDYNGRR